MSDIRLSLRFKAEAVLILMSLAPLLALGLWSQSLVRRAVAASAGEFHSRLAARLADEVSSYVVDMERRVPPGLGDLSGGDLDSRLSDLVRRAPDVRAAAVVDSQGQVRREARSGGPIPKLASLAECRRRTEPVCWAPPLDTRPAILELHRPLREGLFLRLTVVPRRLSDAFETTRIGAGGSVLLIDRQLRPVLFPSRTTYDRIADIPVWLRGSWGASARGARLLAFKGWDGVPQIGSYTPAPSSRAGVMTLQSESDAFAVSQALRRPLLVSVGLFAALSVLLAIWLSERISRPLRRLSEVAVQVAAGAFPETPSLRTGDELQALAEAFQEMVAALKRYSDIHLERILEAQRRIEAMLYSIEDGILMVDESGRFVLANRSAHELAGLQPGQTLEGLRLDDLPLTDETRRVLASALSEPPGADRETELTVGGRPRTIRISARPVVLPKSGERRGVVLALRNVTLEREIERMKDEFLRSITHDLRTPLASIIGFTKYLLKGVGGGLSDDQRQMVSTISEASNRVLALVNDILDLAKMESGRVEVAPRAVSLREVAESTARTLGGVSGQRGVSVSVAGGEIPSVEADPRLMERLLSNLMGNAVKFARENGRVVVSGRAVAGGVEFCVADDGEGVPPAYREKIFEKFEQVPGTKGGTGLGLTISRQIVQLHGGRIWVESEPGRGSRFLFTIPRTFTPAPGA